MVSNWVINILTEKPSAESQIDKVCMHFTALFCIVLHAQVSVYTT